jgi:hypothetical protein
VAGGGFVRMLFLVICLILAVILSTCRNEKLIDYVAINRAEFGRDKVSYDIRVDLVNGRLPTTSEIEAIFRFLHQREKKHHCTFISFYLPGMVLGTGAFATAHYNPNLQEIIYEHLVPEQYKRLLHKPPPAYQPQTALA